jgi:pyrrolidone-carboxylate peptidase
MAELDQTLTDTRPGIVICAWDAGESGWDPVEDLSGEPWSPTGARTVPVPSDEPNALASTLSAHLSDRRCRALLLVGRTRGHGGFRLQMRAENRSLDGAPRPDGVGPSVARATAPVAEMVRALKEAGLAADATSEAEDDAGSYLLYRVLADLPDGSDTPAVGLLRAPENEPDAAVQQAVKAAAQAMARHLSPLPRARAI